MKSPASAGLFLWLKLSLSVVPVKAGTQGLPWPLCYAPAWPCVNDFDDESAIPASARSASNELAS
jgi:hypothetical protein